MSYANGRLFCLVLNMLIPETMEKPHPEIHLTNLDWYMSNLNRTFNGM